MQSVNIADLKNNLSEYLRQVRQGREITIKDRKRVIARIVPAAPPQDDEEELLELVAQGRVRLPEQPIDAAFMKEMLKCELPRVKARGAGARQLIQQVMDEERDRR